MRKLTGGCLCGSVRFEALGEPIIVTACHCTMCRRASGSVFLAFAAYDLASVTFTKGEPTYYRSSDAASRGFCSGCGGALSFIYHAEPQKLWLTLGCFDDAAALSPTEDWFATMTLPWLALDAAIVHRAAMPEGG